MTDKDISLRCQNSQHRRCRDCGCKCHVMLEAGRSVRVKNTESSFYGWTGQLSVRVGMDRWTGSYPISTGLSLNLTFHESELELLGESNG